MVYSVVEGSGHVVDNRNVKTRASTLFLMLSSWRGQRFTVDYPCVVGDQFVSRTCMLRKTSTGGKELESQRENCWNHKTIVAWRVPQDKESCRSERRGDRLTDTCRQWLDTRLIPGDRRRTRVKGQHLAASARGDFWLLTSSFEG